MLEATKKSLKNQEYVILIAETLKEICGPEIVNEDMDIRMATAVVSALKGYLRFDKGNCDLIAFKRWKYYRTHAGLEQPFLLKKVLAQAEE